MITCKRVLLPHQTGAVAWKIDHDRWSAWVSVSSKMTLERTEVTGGKKMKFVTKRVKKSG